METVQQLIERLGLQSHHLWLERALGYGQYKVCFNHLDGTIKTLHFTDSQTWDKYEDIEDGQEAIEFLLSVPLIRNFVEETENA